MPVLTFQSRITRVRASDFCRRHPHRDCTGDSQRPMARFLPWLDSPGKHAIDASWIWIPRTLLLIPFRRLSPCRTMESRFVDGSPLGHRSAYSGHQRHHRDARGDHAWALRTAGLHRRTLTAGTGTLATATITVAAGAVTQVVIANPGIDYLIGDSLGELGGHRQRGGAFRFSSPRYRARRPTAAAPIVDPTGTFVDADAEPISPTHSWRSIPWNQRLPRQQSQ